MFRENELERENVLPLRRAGGDSWTNMVIACQSCNQPKGALTPEEVHTPLLYPAAFGALTKQRPLKKTFAQLNFSTTEESG